MIDIKKKKVVSPEVKLYRRIRKEFDRKKLLGDIKINDDEFNILIKYLRRKYVSICNSWNHVIIDPIFVVALIQIGIRYYDGRYWSYVKKLIDNPNYVTNHQRWIGESITETLKKNNKIYVGESDYVDSLLVHAFVSDNYADSFFNFLYAFYKIDIDRDISRLDRQTMNDLVSVIEKNDNSGRTYYLKEHTADAVRLNKRGCKTRIRRYLNLIDKAFWGEPIPENANNRLMKHFINWKDNSAEFVKERTVQGGKGRAGRKSFSSPYFHYNPSNGFTVILPPQLIRYQDLEDIYWIIEGEDYKKRIDINPYQEGVMGYKTEKLILSIDALNIFSGYTIRLMNGLEALKKFKITKESIRFFDSDGDFVRNDSLIQGNMYSFTLSGFIPESEAAVDSYDNGELLRTDYDFVKGDIIRFPDGKPLSVGGKINEGPLNRGIIDGLISGSANSERVYRDIPNIFVRFQPNKAPGTALTINGIKYKFSKGDKLYPGISSFPLLDRTGDYGYILNLRDIGIKDDGEYEIKLDVPNDRSVRIWKFVLINDFKFEFEEAPYIFKSRGTLAIPKQFDFKSNGNTQEDIQDKRRYNFDIIPGEKYVYLSYKGIDIGFEIPYFSYRFSGENWLNSHHIDIWHGDFNPKISFIYSADKIKVYLDDNGDDTSDEHYEEFFKSKSTGIFECDLNRFKSWFGRDSLHRQIFLELPGFSEPVPFVKIITKSVFKSGMLKADFINKQLIGEFDIIGNSSYFVDVEFDNKLLLEKIELNNNSFSVPSDLKTGIYKIVVYETEDDEFGFGDSVYYQIGAFSTELLNPNDLSGMCIEVTRIHTPEDETSFLQLAKHYQVVKLEKTDTPNVYKGKMIVGKVYLIATFPVLVEFFDLEHLQKTYITFLEDDESLEFLYDEYKRYIVKREDKSLSKSKAYRRYKLSLFPGDYVFDVKFIETPEHVDDEMNDDLYNNKIIDNRSKAFFSKSIFKN